MRGQRWDKQVKGRETVTWELGLVSDAGREDINTGKTAMCGCHSGITGNNEGAGKDTWELGNVKKMLGCQSCVKIEAVYRHIMQCILEINDLCIVFQNAPFLNHL